MRAGVLVDVDACLGMHATAGPGMCQFQSARPQWHHGACMSVDAAAGWGGGLVQQTGQKVLRLQAATCRWLWPPHLPACLCIHRGWRMAMQVGAQPAPGACLRACTCIASPPCTHPCPGPPLGRTSLHCSRQARGGSGGQGPGGGRGCCGLVPGGGWDGGQCQAARACGAGWGQ